MDSVEDFVTNFHNLEGYTIDEKEKSFRKLLYDYKSLLQNQDVNVTIIGKLIPQTYLQNLFKTDVLLYCQRIPDLIEILKNGNEVLICRIIKYDWFFRKAFQDMTAEKIVDDLLPRLSYSIRMKVLKKLCMFLNDQEKLYEIFDTVKSKYGLKVAIPLLLGCSDNRIEFVIRNNPVFFTPTQLRQFIKKSPKLLPLYVEEYKKRAGSHTFLEENHLLRFISSVDYDVFCTLASRYKLEVKYGRRVTRKIFEKEKVNILADPKKYEKNFEKSAFIRKLGEHRCSKNYFSKAFPKKLEDFTEDDIDSYLKFYPKNKRFQLLEEGFKEAYKIPLIDVPKVIKPYIVDMITDSNKREEFIQRVIEVNDDIDLVVYQPISKSIPVLKKEMNLARNKLQRREQLAKAFVKTCKVNDDLTALQDVMKYLAVRLRNDVSNIATFLTSLNDSFDIQSFQKDIWGLVSELLHIMKMKSGTIYTVDLLLARMEFLYNNGSDIEELTREYLFEFKELPSRVLSYKTSNYKFLQLLILNCIKYFSATNNDADYIHRCYCDMIVKISNWNKKHPDYLVSITDHPILTESLKKELEKDWFYYDIRSLICTKHRNDEVDEIAKVYLTKLGRYCGEGSLLYYLKWFPSFVLLQAPQIVNRLSYLSPEVRNRAFKFMKKYDHINLPQNIIECTQKEIDEKKEKLNEDIFEILAHLMSSDRYIDYISKYKPKSLSVDMENKQDKGMYQIQCYVVKNFKHVPSLVVLQHVLSYCGGDFLQCALAPLYKIVFHTQENQLTPFFDELMKTSVSGRKHAVFLTNCIGRLSSIKNTIESAIAAEKNSSLQKRFTLSAFKLFQHNASDDFWKIFKSCLSLIDEFDRELFEILSSAKYVPFKYRYMYFEEVWSLIKKYELLQIHKYNLVNKLASNIKLYVENLSSTFCMELIDMAFMKAPEDLADGTPEIYTFIFEFLLRHKDYERYDKIFKLIESAQISSSGKLHSKAKIYKETNLFINKFGDFILSTGSAGDWSKELLISFLSKLIKIYPEVDFFDNYILLSILLVLLYQLPEVKLEKYVLDISTFSQNLIDTYSPYYVSEVLVNNIADSLKYFGLSDSDDADSIKIEFVKELLSVSPSKISYKISLDIISSCDTTSPGYQEILDMLKACDYPFIHIGLRQKQLFSIYDETT